MVQHSSNLIRRAKRRRQFETADEGLRIATAMAHPTRVRILMAMNTPRRELSPSMFSKETGLDLDHCSYHFKELADAQCIALTDLLPVRGATEHIYEPLQTALAWTSEWKKLKPEIKRGVLTSVLAGGVQALGSAIDTGTFEARPESHLSWNTIETDEQGWMEISTVLDDVLMNLRRVEDACLQRIDNGAEHFLVSYFLGSFESPPKDQGEAPRASGLPEDAPPLRPTKDRQRLKRREGRLKQDEQQIMAKMMSHPTRVRILMAMNTPLRLMSPKAFAEESGLAVQHVAYHFGELEDTGCIALVYTEQRGGATEHIYEPQRAAIQWTDDWKLLGPAVKQTFLASVMRGAVEALGIAIDSGTFEARPASHMGWSTIRVDERGWSEIAAILDRGLLKLMEVQKRSVARICSGWADPFAASFFMAAFEAPPKVHRLAE